MASGTDKFDKQWVIRSIQVAQPAAGADWSITVPANAVWRIKAIFARLATSATVANRFPTIVYDDGTNALYATAVTSIAASGSAIIIGAAGVGNVGAANGAFPAVDGVASTGNMVASALPDLVLAPGFRVSSATFALQTGDQWSNISLLVEQAEDF